MTSMDPRCPRRLKDLPDTWCAYAVMRLKALKNAGPDISPEDEERLPGCPWAVHHQMANYCFFNQMTHYCDSDGMSPHDIARALCLSVETVRDIEKSVIDQFRNMEMFVELKESLNGESIVSDHNSQLWLDEEGW